MTMNTYGNLTQLKSVGWLNISGTTYDTDLLAIMEGASREIDKYCRRWFYTYEGIRYYDGAASRLIVEDDIYSVTTLLVDKDGDGVYETTYNLTTVPVDAYLYPLNITPKTRLEINPYGNQGHFGSGFRNNVKVTGVFGHGADWPATPYLDSGAVVNTGGITSSALTHALATGKGASFAVGQTVRLDSEQLYISGISTDTLTWQRGMNGTTAAAHLAAAVIYICQYPAAITRATLMQASRIWKRRESAFATVVGNAMTGQYEAYKGLDPDVAEVVKHYQRDIQPRYVG